MAEAELRQRSSRSRDSESSTSPTAEASSLPPGQPEDDGERGRAGKERPTYGRTPDGVVFKVPETHDTLSALFDPRLPKSWLDLITLATLGFQVAMFFILPLRSSRHFFLPFFAFWRLAYNGFLGWILKRQSERKWIVKTVKRMGWMDPEVCPGVARWLHAQLRAKMGQGFDIASVPLEFNVWLLFRQVVDIILMNDFLAFTLFCFGSINTPEGHSTVMHVLRWITGVSLLAFNIWVKVDAHRIIHDFAWFWGDAFFISLAELRFDGVFEMAPHPMYSIGYAWFYGASLMTASHVVLLASLAAHLCQFGFLVYFETPHIERTYGQKKPLTARDPLPRSRQATAGSTSAVDSNLPTPRAASPASVPDQTPSQTDGDSDTESAGPYSDFEDFASIPPSMVGYHRRQDRGRAFSSSSGVSAASSTLDLPSSLVASGLRPGEGPSRSRRERPLTRQDLDNRYFRKDLIVFHNFDIFRSRDLGLALAVFYTVCAMALPADMSGGSHLILVAANAVAWRLFHSFGLGMALKWQSERKWIVRHFLKRYYYDLGSSGSANATAGVEEAFRNWKATYNLSLLMTYLSFGFVALKFYTVPRDPTVGTEVLRHALGFSLIGLHVWSARSSYDVLGDFGWFYGDFFIEDYPVQLAYTGIYRFLNNPERSMGGAALFGLVLIAGSKVVLALALFSVLSHWWFLSFVENPHMRKLYGDAIRKDAGLTKTLKNAAKRNAHLVQRAPPQLAKRIREVQGTFEQIYEETAEALDDFLDKSTPRLSDVVRDTKVLLQQSSERLVLTRVSHDLSRYDHSQYSVKVEPSPFAESTTGTPLRFHLGEPITVRWTAPTNHARGDWIGVYRAGANKSRLVTRVASHGKWIGVYDDEWDGDIHIGRGSGSSKDVDADAKSGKLDEGRMTFTGKKLPWKEGLYEFRYHHDGKHNVMTTSDVCQIYIERPRDAHDEAVHDSLSRIITFVLGVDGKLAPRNVPALAVLAKFDPSKAVPDGARGSREGDDSLEEDPDDFVLMDRDQAKHVAEAISTAFDVELHGEVVVADANVAKLTDRIRATRELLRPFSPRVAAES